jgi:hypothetical protein
MPVWRGESLLNKTITVQMEQGFGDIIMFARFLPALKAMGAKKVTVLQESSLHHLLGQLDCVDTFTNDIENGAAVESDYWIGSMSLPYYISLMHPMIKAMFPVTRKKIIGSEGYFHAQPSNIPAKIGVNWEASKQIMYYLKSVDVREMEQLTGSDCYSLNPKSEGMFNPLPDDGWKTNWVKTAAHIKACKGVVTVDTGTAHLAGALGVKTIVLLPKDEFICWRWKNGRWYDSVVCLTPDEYDKVPELLKRM